MCTTNKNIFSPGDEAGAEQLDQHQEQLAIPNVTVFILVSAHRPIRGWYWQEKLWQKRPSTKSVQQTRPEG